MSDRIAFFDTNVLLYLASGDMAKAQRAEDLVADGGTISVQVLNEFTLVALRKFGMAWVEVRENLAVLRASLAVEPLTIATHERGLAVAERYNFRIYDGLIIAAALLAGCDTLYSEDLQTGQVIEGTLAIRNPFI